MTPQALVAEVQLSIGVDAQHHYNFAFCGGAGTGKSSVVNALRGVADPPRHSPELGGEAPAPVGIGETTTRSLRYDYPAAVGLPFLKLWDMPGGGLVGHPSATYFMDMRLYAFDALFILADARIVEVATHVIQAALEHHVPVAFVYTKADLAVAALKRPGVIPNATDDAIIAAVRKDKKADFDKMVASAFPGAGIKMFIISSHNMADNACKFDELTFAAFAARANSQRQVAPDTLPAAGSGAGAVPL
jgi:GTP-binding protein EngB required for normal cell division